MKNFVIINGVNSNTINGLGINELPPISKPSMRVQQEVIDGRDGDITTNLGYSAYDKTITIGLFGTGYDINDIISFFNGEGTIVFSNEDDKYYKYKIINQIDYEALQKFKQATITFHCQPFKYPLEETPLEIEYEYIEQDGVESATMNNTNGGTSLKIDLKGNTSQYSTTGKQLFNATLLDNVEGIVIEGNGKTIKLPIKTSGNGFIGLGIKLSALCPTLNVGDTAYVIFNRNLGTTYNNFIYLNGVSQTWNNGSSKTITQEMLDSNVSLYANRYEDGETGQCILTDFRIVKNSTDIWEEYTGGQPAPSPSYPQPINVVSGDNEVVVCGKNLCSSITKPASANLDFHFDKGIQQTITISFTSNEELSNNSLYLNVDGTSYGITARITGSANTRVSATITLSDTDYQAIKNGTDIYFRLYKSGANFTLPMDAQIENNNEATPYEPYKSQTYPINLGELELCKIGDYQDYFTKNSEGQWCKYNAIGEVDLSTKTFTGYDVGDGYKFLSTTEITDVKYASSNTELIHCFANNYIEHAGSGMSGTSGRNHIAIDTNAVRTNTQEATPSGLFCYPLSRPYLSLIENKTLISQLDNIQNAMSYEGQTNVSQVNNDKPFLLDLIAMKKGTDEVVINNIGNVYAKPTIALEGTGETDIYLNNTEILKVDLSEKNKITIDTNNMEAYDPTDNSLANRKVIGNYNSMTLPSGNTTMKITGALTKATITDYSRWL